MRQSSAERRTRRERITTADALFFLENGARMDQKRFHALYLKAPEELRAELIGGIVHIMPSPVSLLHGEPHCNLVALFTLYRGKTKGVRSGDNTTSILGKQSEPQPDAFLMIQPEYGGQAKFDKRTMVHGAPELIAEIAHTTTSIDLGRKKEDYEQAGVKEYVVVVVLDRSIRWFISQGDQLVERPLASDGIYRSHIMPGLWLKPKSLFSQRTNVLEATLRRGLASPEHAAFVKELAARKKRLTPKSRKKK